MSKRVRFSENVDCAEPPEKLSKHTLDSDEEDETEEDKSGVLDTEEIEGQEDRTVDFDNEIRITPFNMEDEMEDGHFDASGTFIFKKKTEIRDNWLDNIDWMTLPPDQRRAVEDQEDNEDADKIDPLDKQETMPESDVVDLYKEIVNYLEPGETVLKAMRRLGKLSGSKSKSASERWKKPKPGKAVNSQSDPIDSDKEIHRNSIIRLTEIADKLLQVGEYDVYEETLEKLNYRIKSHQQKIEERNSISMDMFSEENNGGKSDSNLTSTSNDAVWWELKRLKSESATIEGPYSTKQLIEWKEKGDFATEEVYIRRAGTSGEFYSSRRIDFELYG